MPRKPDIKEWPFTSKERVQLTPALLEGFVSIYLMDRLDNPQPIPDLHREIWRMFCLPDPLVALAAPRGHAKSTAGTHTCGLCSVLFGAEDHVLILSATESMASDHLKDIASELEENEGIVKQFNVRLTVNNGTEIIGYVGGRIFRVIAKGAEQRVRGIKWRHKRPGLILIDDLEEDEAVMNEERRIKLREWVQNAVMPLGSDKCHIRAWGTILHFDSWLERTMHSKVWVTKRFSAHKDFDDFSNILWPEKFPETRLRAIRQTYLDDNNPSGYAQEYLNWPIAKQDAYFLESDFIPMEAEDHLAPKNYYVGGDFAISKKDRANCTSFTIGGVCSKNLLHIVDNHTDRLDSLQIVDKMFEIHDLWHPECWFLEKGMIEESIGPFLTMEMIRRGKFLHIILMQPVQDKPSRARSLQARMRAGGTRWDDRATWYPPMKMELMQFPRSGKDDRTDSAAWLGRGITDMQEALTPLELMQIQADEEERAYLDQGRNKTTGY
jgi:predicted phage terminase large subunit-like protein